MTDIVERLKSWDRCYPGNINIEDAVDEAADEIERLRKENKKLREALKPFADAVTDEYSWKYDINSDDFRAAAAAIRESGDE